MLLITLDTFLRGYLKWEVYTNKKQPRAALKVNTACDNGHILPERFRETLADSHTTIYSKHNNINNRMIKIF